MILWPRHETRRVHELRVGEGFATGQREETSLQGLELGFKKRARWMPDMG